MTEPEPYFLTHWGRVTYICVSKLTIIGSDNGLSPRRRQAIIWTNAGILLIGPFGTKLSAISIEIVRVSFKKIRLKGSSAKWRPFCLGLNELIKSHVNIYVGWQQINTGMWQDACLLSTSREKYGRILVDFRICRIWTWKCVMNLYKYDKMFQLIESEWLINVSVNKASIGSDNCLRIFGATLLSSPTLEY